MDATEERGNVVKTKKNGLEATDEEREIAATAIAKIDKEMQKTWIKGMKWEIQIHGHRKSMSKCNQPGFMKYYKQQGRRKYLMRG